MTLRIEVDDFKCSGLGLCEAVSPEYFEVLEDGSLKILDEHPSDADRAVVEEAIAACPTEALRLIVE